MSNTVAKEKYYNCWISGRATKIDIGKYLLDDDDQLGPPIMEGLLKEAGLETALGGDSDLAPMHGKHAREGRCFRHHQRVS